MFARNVVGRPFHRILQGSRRMIHMENIGG